MDPRLTPESGASGASICSPPARTYDGQYLASATCATQGSPTGTLARQLGIRPAALDAWRDLLAALDDMTTRGRRPACTTDPDTWTSHLPNLRRDAAEACSWCPARTACARFADANGEALGIWGGRDCTPRRKPKGAIT